MDGVMDTLIDSYYYFVKLMVGTDGIKSYEGWIEGTIWLFLLSVPLAAYFYRKLGR